MLLLSSIMGSLLNFMKFLRARENVIGEEQEQEG